MNDAAVRVSDTVQACVVLAIGGALLGSPLLTRWLGLFALGGTLSTLGGLALGTGWRSLPISAWFMTSSVVLMV